MDRPRRSARKRAHDAAAAEQKEQKQVPRSLVPTEEDIMLGRGVKHVGKTGNARYYELLDWYLPAYDAADTKGAKRAIVRSVYDELQSRGTRFLKHDTRSGYNAIDPRHGKKKISHALRYRKRHQQDCDGSEACWMEKKWIEATAMVMRRMKVKTSKTNTAELGLHRQALRPS